MIIGDFSGFVVEAFQAFAIGAYQGLGVIINKECSRNVFFVVERYYFVGLWVIDPHAISRCPDQNVSLAVFTEADAKDVLARR